MNYEEIEIEGMKEILRDKEEYIKKLEEENKKLKEKIEELEEYKVIVDRWNNGGTYFIDKI